MTGASAPSSTSEGWGGCSDRAHARVPVGTPVWALLYGFAHVLITLVEEGRLAARHETRTVAGNVTGSRDKR